MRLPTGLVFWVEQKLPVFLARAYNWHVRQEIPLCPLSACNFPVTADQGVVQGAGVARFLALGEYAEATPIWLEPSSVRSHFRLTTVNPGNEKSFTGPIQL
jgi:hypothetical protein